MSVKHIFSFLKKGTRHLSKMHKNITKIRDDFYDKKEPSSDSFALDATIDGVSSKPQEKLVVEVSLKSILKVTAVVLGIVLLLFFVYNIQDILLLFLFSLIIASAIDPLVDKLEEAHIPRALSIIGIYILILLFFVVIVALIIPMLVEQIGKLAQNTVNIVQQLRFQGVHDLPIPFLPQDLKQRLLDSINSFAYNPETVQTITNEIQKNLNQIRTSLADIAGNVFGALGIIFNGIFNALLVLVLTFFMLIDKSNIQNFVRSFVPHSKVWYFTQKAVALNEKIGGWLRGQLLLCIVVGLETYIGFFILALLGVNIEYKETLAVIAAITEIIPIAGPLIGMVPALLIALNQHPIYVIWVAILYLIVQQTENNILVPIIMKHAVGLNPVIIIIAMLIGAKFFGLVGVVLAIPLTTAIGIFLKDLQVHDHPTVSKKHSSKQSSTPS